MVAPGVFSGQPGGDFALEAEVLYDGMLSDGQREVTSVALPQGGRALVEMWPFWGQTLLQIYRPGWSELRTLAGSYTAGVLGIDGGAGEPARVVAWGDDGVAVVTLQDEQAFGCLEATWASADGVPPFDVQAVDAQGLGHRVDLAAIETNPESRVVILAR